MRKLILNLAMSLDGYIAEEDGSYDWITGDRASLPKTERKWDYNRFLEDVDAVIMGRVCFEQGMHKDFPDKKVYIASSRDVQVPENCSLIQGDLCDFMQREKEKEGKNIFLFGGGIVASQFMARDLIDEYVFGLIPVLLGKGRPLFLGGAPRIPLTLSAYYLDEGIPILHYVRRKSHSTLSSSD